jgi:hypothetical protein
VSPAVIGLKSIKVGKAIENIDESHGLTPIVAICHSDQKSGDMGFESPSLRQFEISDFSPQAAWVAKRWPGSFPPGSARNRFHPDGLR